jgi:hypothetical protein
MLYHLLTCCFKNSDEEPGACWNSTPVPVSACLHHSLAERWSWGPFQPAPPVLPISPYTVLSQCALRGVRIFHRAWHHRWLCHWPLVLINASVAGAEREETVRFISIQMVCTRCQRGCSTSRYWDDFRVLVHIDRALPPCMLSAARNPIQLQPTSHHTYCFNSFFIS